jgi:hypothetical protein
MEHTTLIVVKHVHSPKEEGRAVESEGKVGGVAPGGDFESAEGPVFIVGDNTCNTVGVKEVIVYDGLGVPLPNFNSVVQHNESG